MHSKKTSSSALSKDKKGFVKVKNLIPKTPNESNNDAITPQRGRVNCNIKSLKMNNEENNKLNNLNSSVASNGRADHSREKALKIEDVDEKFSDIKIRKITPNLRGRSYGNLKNERKNKLGMKEEVNGKEEEEISKSFLNDKETIFTTDRKDNLRKSLLDKPLNNVSIINDKLRVLIKSSLNKPKNKNSSFRKLDNYFRNDNKKNSYSQSKDEVYKPNVDCNKHNFDDNNHNNHSLNIIDNSIKDDVKVMSSKEIQLTISPEKDFSRSICLEKSFDKYSEKDFKILSTYERFKNKEELIYAKKQELKRKIEEAELYERKNKPEVNTARKFYGGNNKLSYLKRMENNKLNSSHKKIESANKQKIKEEARQNQNLRLKAKKTFAQIQKIFSEKLNNQKTKMLERKTKISFLKKELEKNELKECTFTPHISKGTRELDVSAKRRKYDLARPKSATNLNEDEFNCVKKYYKLDKLDPAYSMHKISYFIKLNHGEQKSSDDLNINFNSNLKSMSNCNSNNNTNISNIFSNSAVNRSFGNTNGKKNNRKQNVSFSLSNNDNVCLTFNNNESDNDDKENKSLNKNKRDIDNNVSFNNEIRKTLNVPISTKLDFANNDINISKRESDILRELLMKKLNI